MEGCQSLYNRLIAGGCTDVKKLNLVHCNDKKISKAISEDSNYFEN